MPEQTLARLAVGMPAELKLPGVEGAVAGRVRLVNQEVDKASRTGKVRIALEDVCHAHIGAFASGQVELARRDGVGAPATALERDGDEGAPESCKRRQGRGAAGEAGHHRRRLGGNPGGRRRWRNVVARAAAFLRAGDRVRPTAETTAANG